MPTIRKCSQCGEATLTLKSREMELYNSRNHYQCSHCDHEIEFQPKGSLGVLLTVAMVAAIIIWVIFLPNSYDRDWISLTIYVVFVSFVPFMVLREMLKYRTNPLVQTGDPEAEIGIEDNDNIAAKPISWVEKLGFLGGMIVPVVLIVGVLGIAALIGYINFTYFR